MSKYSLETKFKVIQYVLEEKHSMAEASKIFGMCKSDIQKWINAYQHNGIEGLSIKNGTYSGDFKISVVEYIRNNKASARETAAVFNIPSYSTVCKWERIYLEEGASALFSDGRGRPKTMSKPKENEKAKLSKKTEEDLITENQRLRMENAYLKKLNALVRERIQRENGKK